MTFNNELVSDIWRFIEEVREPGLEADLNQKSEVRSQKSEVRSRLSGVATTGGRRDS
jgi:hypothetical protein